MNITSAHRLEHGMTSNRATSRARRRLDLYLQREGILKICPTGVKPTEVYQPSTKSHPLRVRVRFLPFVPQERSDQTPLQLLRLVKRFRASAPRRRPKLR